VGTLIRHGMKWSSWISFLYWSVWCNIHGRRNWYGRSHREWRRGSLKHSCCQKSNWLSKKEYFGTIG
jgi:hypothetical protein